MRSFSLSVIEEFDAPSDRPTWLVKLDGKPVARVVKLPQPKRDGLVLVKPFAVMTEGFEANAPWEPERDAKTYRSAFQAAMAVAADRVID